MVLNIKSLNFRFHRIFKKSSKIQWTHAHGSPKASLDLFACAANFHGKLSEKLLYLQFLNFEANRNELNEWKLEKH